MWRLSLSRNKPRRGRNQTVSFKELVTILDYQQLTRSLTLGEKILVFVFQDRVSLYSPACPRTHFVDQVVLELRGQPASASWVLGLKVCATTAWPRRFFCCCTFLFWFGFSCCGEAMIKQTGRKKEFIWLIGYSLLLREVKQGPRGCN